MLHADLTPQATQLDAVNRALLPVIRHFLDALLAPQTMGWRTALATASGTWGEARGLAIANAVQMFLTAVLRNRPVPLRYSDPLDLKDRLRLTSDEVDLLALIASMRSDTTPQSRVIIARLTGGEIRSEVVRTGLSLAALLEPTDAQRRATPHRPTLRLV